MPSSPPSSGKSMRIGTNFTPTLTGGAGGLTSCDRSAALAAFRGFAADANGITRQARNLPSSGLANALADTTIDAVVLEDQALRQLRDGWQPGHVDLA